MNNTINFRLKMNIQYGLKKKRAYKNKYQNDEEEDETENVQKKKVEVYCDNNHIYFRGDVTIEKVNQLCELIEGYNREHDLIKSSTFTSIVVPKPIYLHITSHGGDLIAGFLAHDYIKNSKIPIYTIADGYAISSGSTMFMAGKRRFMTENSYVLIHQLNQTDYSTNTFHDMMDNAMNVIEFMKRIYKLVLTNVRHSPNCESEPLTKEKLENHVLHDIYWDFETCQKYGLVDDIYYNYDKADENDIQKIVESTVSKKSSKRVEKNSMNFEPSANFIQRVQQRDVADKTNANIVNAISAYLQNANQTDEKNKDQDSDDIGSMHVAKKHRKR